MRNFFLKKGVMAIASTRASYRLGLIDHHTKHRFEPFSNTQRHPHRSSKCISATSSPLHPSSLWSPPQRCPRPKAHTFLALRSLVWRAAKPTEPRMYVKFRPFLSATVAPSEPPAELRMSKTHANLACTGELLWMVRSVRRESQ